jgi:hypothetical protein
MSASFLREEHTGSLSRSPVTSVTRAASPGAASSAGASPSGNYALADGERILATVERKTFDNLLADFGVMPVLHQRLLELAKAENHALVVEAPYEDFLNGRRVHHYTPAFCARVIAELYATHPGLRIVFCSNRKAANEWTRNFFAAVAALHYGTPPQGGVWKRLDSLRE